MSDLYLTLSELPTYTSVRFLSPNELSVTSSIADHDKKKKQSKSKSIILSPQLKVSEYEDTDSIKATIISPSKNRRAILKQTEDKDAPTSKRRFVEIWKGSNLEASKNVTDDHGEFYIDEFYRSLSFSPSENALVYGAEANEPGSTPSDPYAAFRYTPPLGEGFPGKHRPTLFIFRWLHDSDATSVSLNPISIKQQLPLPVLFGQASFIGEETLVATGHEQTPEGRLLGLKYCQNRPSGIYILENATGSGKCNATRLTSPERSCRSARLSPDEKRLHFLSNHVLGAHASCASLQEYSLATKTIRTVVDTVSAPSGDNDDSFPGLYIDQLPTQPFIFLPQKEGLHIITQSIWRSKIAVLLISVEDGNVTNLTVNDRSNWTVLTTDRWHRFVCVKCSINEPPELVLGNTSTFSSTDWKTIDKPQLSQDVKEKLASLVISVLRIPGRGPAEATFIRNTFTAEPCHDVLPCITYIHGGPHSTSTQSFNAEIITRALDGYNICIPNYTGSLGFGQKNVQKLIGQCGTLDVEDCMESIRHLINLGISKEGPGKQFVIGGSHGGFITGHLIGKYPDFFSAAVIRNPVISVGETAATDILDWYYSEFGYSYEPTTLMTPQLFQEMQAVSPIQYVDNVKTPVLLSIGGEDKRVAPTQGTNYYHALKGRSKKVEMLIFKKDGHPLDGVEAARIQYEAGRDWLMQAAREAN